MKSIPCLLLVLAAVGMAVGPPGAAPAAPEIGGELSWKVDYDAQGRTAAITDPAGRRTRFSVAPDGGPTGPRQVVRTSPDGTTVTRDLDERGRLVAMHDTAGALVYGYDDLGRLNRVAREGSLPILYTHDAADRITRLSVGEVYRIDYHYDFLGRLEAMDTPAGPVRYEYLTGQGKVVRRLPNGVATLWHYSPDGTLETITHLLQADPKGTRAATLSEYNYRYRPDGLIASVAERSDTGKAERTYSYDKVGRLVRAQGLPRPQYVYGYDQVDNRTQTLSTLQARRRFGFDWAGRLADIEGVATTHDAAGNLTALTLGGKTWRYGFDSDNRLAGVGGAQASYRYDGDGNLIGRSLGGARLTFIPDPLADDWRPLVIAGAQGERTLVVWDGATPLMLIRQGRPEYLLHDHQGSVRLIADGRGQVVRRIDYEPYGLMEDTAAAQDFAPRFAGLFWDPAGAIYLTRARAYSPGLGRFLQVDPQHRVPRGGQQDLGLYAYCGNDPQNFVDTSGATRTPAELRSDIRDRGSELMQKQREMQDAMRFQQMELRDRQAEMIVRIREQAQGVAARQLQGAETFRNNVLYTEPRVVGVTAVNVAEMVCAPFGGLGCALLNGVAGGARERWLEDLQDRDAQLGSITNAQRSTASGIGETIGWIRRGVQFGMAARVEGSFPHDKFNDLGFSYGRDKLVKRIAQTASYQALAGDGTRSASVNFGAGRPAPDAWPTRAAGHLLNFVGKQSNWIGANRSGDAFAQPWQRDSLGRLPLGNTNIGATGKAGPSDRNVRWDEAAKWHDTQDYVNWHADRGTEVKVPWGNGHYKYFISRGEGSKTHDGEVFLLASGIRSKFPMTDAPSTRNPIALSEIKAKYPVVGTPPSRGTTSVGGVYLGGSGQSLNGVGLLDGIALDDNSNLILLGQGGNQIGLPPLRLDDVVTIFRSVYLYGEAPSVSIDPNPDNPKGSAMLIRHGQATADTYVGWVLFQADRLMKAYTLGADNNTDKAIKTQVPGYAKILDTLFFGGGLPKKGQQREHWERFWIVPAETNRVGADPRALTLFDVPLKVKTQAMKWDNGKLVDDTSGASSPGAAAFTGWFTERYEAIAAERLLLPPPASGITRPVPVFTELRRIALMTAIAEKLRDQGIPLPFWMRDYQVTPVPFERSTPGLERKKANGRIIAQVFGGVSLAADDKAVRSFDLQSDLSGLDAPRRDLVRADLVRAAALAGAVRAELPLAEPLAVKTLEGAGAGSQAVALPGAETQALAPARLDEVDLSVPIAGELRLELVRRYNSFFNPNGPWGRGWALDLPRLEALRVPVRREGDSVLSQTAYESVTPLNSSYTRFSRVEPVSALNNSQLMVPDASAVGEPSEFLGLADAQPDFVEGPTHELIRKDGGAWHFDQAGNLAAIVSGGVRLVYERDSQGRLNRILGLLGGQQVASITLTYNAAGLIESAAASSLAPGAQVGVARYRYDASGRLVGVESTAGTLGYRYQGAWVTAVTLQTADARGEPEKAPAIRTFEYDARGRLVREAAADGTATDYRIAAEANGSSLTTGPAGSDASETIRYDRAFRPIAAHYADGTGAAWRYPDQGGTLLDLSGADGTAVARMTESADRRHRTLAIDGGTQFASEHDEAGRLTALAENGRTLLTQAWSADGRLEKAGTQFQAEHYEYGPDGLVSRVLLTPPNAGDRFETWQAARLDPFGRAVEVTDHSGMHLAMRYDGAGDIKELVTQQDGQSFGVSIARDAAGRVAGIASPSGSQQYSYDADGFIKALREEKRGATAGAEWHSGLLRRVKQFDGGELSLDYFDDGERAGLLRSVTTPDGLALAYEYRNDNQLVEVKVGNRSRMLFDYDGSGRVTAWRYRPAPGR